MKKVKNILILILLIAFASCEQEKQSEESKFKSYVGIGEFEQLNSFMKTMENKFMTTYEVDNLNDAYNSYTINKVLGDSHLKFNINDCESLRAIEESGLLDKHVNLKYDSVYNEDNIVVTVHEKDTSWLLKPPEKREGEYRDKIKKEGFRFYVHYNELYDGIKYSNEKDTLISQIVEARIEIGYINTERLTEAIHLEKVDYEKQFIYRILICMESYLNELKEYGC